MFETEIIRIPMRLFGQVNAYLIRNAAACILVDTGPPGSERRIAHVLARHGLSFRDIRLIILTHGHADCAGNAARLRELSGAPILAHEDDADLYRQQDATAYCATGGIRRIFRNVAISDQPYRGFEPDIGMKRGEQINLLDFAIDGVVRHVGGHTPGSIVVELASRDVLAGDLVASGTAAADDPQRVSHELERLLEGGARRFHLGHGGPLDASAIRHRRKARRTAG